MSEPGLRSLLNLDTSAEAFLATYWPEQMYIAKGPVERLAGLVDYDFDALVRMKKHHTKAFFRGVDGTSQSIVIEPGQEKPLYDAGFTIYFHNLSSPKIAQWVSTLDGELGLVRGHTRVASFASRRGLGLKPHYDQNDNFVCQAKGTKRWRIWPNTSVKHPTVGYTVGGKMTPTHEVEAPEGFPKEMGPHPQVVDMVEGTVMYMPRGMWHDTETVESESLHFNIQSGMAMWKDAIEYVLTRTSALHREDLRAPIVGLFDGDQTREGFADELKAKLRAAVDEICDSEIVLHAQPFYKFIASRRPRG
jgi:ribosomal protein L16 Arg81 hydroxylase